MVRITGAQARIAHHVSMGHTNSDVAAITGLSERTVKNHLNAIYKHAGVVNRNELIQAYRTGRLGVEDAHGEQHHHA
jgi:DNA-binding CsgD family transcriptional regulator